MSVFTQNFVADQGADLVFTTQPYVVNGAIQNFTGATASMMLRVLPTDTTPALSLTQAANANGSILTPNGALGTLTLTINNKDSKGVAPSLVSPGILYQYDLFVTMSGGAVVKLLVGTILFTPSATH